MALQASDRLVIFGITGDLAHKMTWPSLYRLERREMIDVPILGVAFDDITTADLIKLARSAIEKVEGKVDDQVFKRLAARLSYLHGDFTDDTLYEQISRACEGSHAVTFYLEIPPSLFVTVAQKLVAVGLTTGDSRIVFEKPFGTSLKTAEELNKTLHSLLREEQIFRIDHYLGKDPVMDVMYLRFANSIFESVWNDHYVSAIMITMAEDFGVDDRGSFYDAVGTIRDVVQNHLLQVLALVTMEIPVADLTAPRLDVFRCIPDADPTHAVLGQYAGYQDVKGVKRGSLTETFVALQLQIDSLRWGGTPVLIRAGKCLPVKATEVVVRLRRLPPIWMAGKQRRVRHDDDIVLRLGGDPGVDLTVRVKSAGADDLEPVNLNVDFRTALGEVPEPYEVLLTDALAGDKTRFPDEKSIEETWRIVQPLLDTGKAPQPYRPGSWGPQAAIDMAARFGGWRTPMAMRLAQDAGTDKQHQERK